MFSTARSGTFTLRVTLCALAMCVETPLGGSGATQEPIVVEVERFRCEHDDDDAWWIAITAQRKLIEWLADGGIWVKSALTKVPDSLGEPSCSFSGEVALADSVATLSVELVGAFEVTDRLLGPTLFQELGTPVEQLQCPIPGLFSRWRSFLHRAVSNDESLLPFRWRATWCKMGTTCCFLRDITPPIVTEWGEVRRWPSTSATCSSIRIGSLRPKRSMM